MAQTKAHSLIESWTNVIVGAIISFSLSQLAHSYQSYIDVYIWRGFVWNLSLESNIIMTIVLTFASFIRGYLIRRAFNLGEKTNDKA